MRKNFSLTDMVKHIFACTCIYASTDKKFDNVICSPTDTVTVSGVCTRTELLTSSGEDNIISFINYLKNNQDLGENILIVAPSSFLEQWLSRRIENIEQVASMFHYNGLPEPILIDSTTKFFKTWGDAPHEPETFNIFRKFLSKDRPYLDIGVCYGQTAIYGSLLSKHVIGVEPDPYAFRDASSNLNINRYKNITLIPCALGDKSGVVKFGSKSGNWGNSKSTLLIDANTKHTVDVEIRTFASLNEECPLLSEINFIKMDVEGGEKFIVPNMVEYLKIQGVSPPTLYISLHTKWGLITEGEEEAILDLLYGLYGDPLHRDMDKRLTKRQITKSQIEQLIYTSKKFLLSK